MGIWYKERNHQFLWNIITIISALAPLYSLIQTTCHLGETLVYNFYENMKFQIKMIKYFEDAFHGKSNDIYINFDQQES